MKISQQHYEEILKAPEKWYSRYPFSGRRVSRKDPTKWEDFDKTELVERDKGILDMYLSENYKTETIAEKYNVTSRTVCRVVGKYAAYIGLTGVVRTIAEQNKLSAKFKKYWRLPEELKVHRKFLKSSVRYKIIKEHPYCKTCGSTASDGVRLEVDHIDNNPQNSSSTNLRVICYTCNKGKYWLYSSKKNNPPPVQNKKNYRF